MIPTLSLEDHFSYVYRFEHVDQGLCVSISRTFRYGGRNTDDAKICYYDSYCGCDCFLFYRQRPGYLQLG